MCSSASLISWCQCSSSTTPDCAWHYNIDIQFPLSMLAWNTRKQVRLICCPIWTQLLPHKPFSATSWWYCSCINSGSQVRGIFQAGSRSHSWSSMRIVGKRIMATDSMSLYARWQKMCVKMGSRMWADMRQRYWFRQARGINMTKRYAWPEKNCFYAESFCPLITRSDQLYILPRFSSSGFKFILLF